MSATFTTSALNDALYAVRLIEKEAEAAKRRSQGRDLAMSEQLAIATKANREIDAMRTCAALLEERIEAETPVDPPIEPDHDHERAARKEAEARARAPRQPGRYT